MIPLRLVVNVYNGERFLRETLASLAAQDYSKTIVHCFDNQSTDATQEIIAEFAAQHSNFRNYVLPEHMRLVDARNFALEELRKESSDTFYFAFCDADDLWEPTWSAKLMKHAGDGYDLLYSNGYTLKEGRELPVNSCLSMLRPTPYACPVFLQSCMFNSALIPGQGTFFDPRFPIIYDTEFWLRRGQRLSYIHVGERLFRYRIHANSMARSNYFPIFKEIRLIRRTHKLPLLRFIYGFLRHLLHILQHS